MKNDWNSVQAQLRADANISGPKDVLLREIELLDLTDTGVGAIARLKLKSKLTASMFDRLLMPDLKSRQQTGEL